MGLGGGALLEKLEQRSNPSLHDDHLLVAVVVTRERPELVGSVGAVLGLAHLDGGDEGPDPGEDGVVAGDGGEGEVSAVGVEDRKQPLHVADGGLQEARDLAEVGSGGDGEDLAEDATMLALADKG